MAGSGGDEQQLDHPRLGELEVGRATVRSARRDPASAAATSARDCGHERRTVRCARQPRRSSATRANLAARAASVRSKPNGNLRTWPRSAIRARRRQAGDPHDRRPPARAAVRRGRRPQEPRRHPHPRHRQPQPAPRVGRGGRGRARPCATSRRATGCCSHPTPASRWRSAARSTSSCANATSTRWRRRAKTARPASTSSRQFARWLCASCASFTGTAAGCGDRRRSRAPRPAVEVLDDRACGASCRASCAARPPSTR